MRSTKALNGLPNTLVQMYFSTHAYYRNGYMADHLWAAAARTGIREARLHVLKGTAEPAAFSTPAITSYLPQLRHQVQKEFAHLGFPPNHITAAYIDIFISEQHEAKHLQTGTGVVVTAAGKTITGKTYTEAAFPRSDSNTGPTTDGDRPWSKLW